MPSKIAEFFLLTKETKPKLVEIGWFVLGFMMMLFGQAFGLTKESAAGVWFLLGPICAWAFGSISTLCLEIEKLKSQVGNDGQDSGATVETRVHQHHHTLHQSTRSAYFSIKAVPARARFRRAFCLFES